MRNFKSEPDLPKEPKAKYDEAQEAPTTTPRAKSKAKPKPQARDKPRAVASPAISRRSKPSNCMLLSALVGIMKGQRGEGAEVMKADRHDIVSLPYLPEGGAFSAPFSTPRNLSPAPTAVTTPTSTRSATLSSAAWEKVDPEAVVIGTEHTMNGNVTLEPMIMNGKRCPRRNR